jgi:hypothetical protein
MMYMSAQFYKGICKEYEIMHFFYNVIIFNENHKKNEPNYLRFKDMVVDIYWEDLKINTQKWNTSVNNYWKTKTVIV